MPLVPNPEPSERQLEVVQFIIDHVERWGFQPNQQEMADHFGVSKTAIQGRLREAARRGLIEIENSRERAIVLKNVRFHAKGGDMPKGPVNKSAIVRDFLSRFPLLGPSAIIAEIAKEHPDIQVRPQQVSTEKARMKTKEQGNPPPLLEHDGPSIDDGPSLDEEQSAFIPLSELLTILKELIRLYGKDEIKKTIDLLD
jgi:hypothetical protein